MNRIAIVTSSCRCGSDAWPGVKIDIIIPFIFIVVILRQQLKVTSEYWMLRLEQQSGRRIFVASRPQSTLVRLREMLATPEDLRRKIEAMATRYDARFPSVFETIQ